MLEYATGRSSRPAAFCDHAGACENFFSGGTDEEDEDKALGIIMRSESYDEPAFMVERLTWDVLDDELDESDLTTIAGRLSELRNRDEHAIDRVLRGSSLERAVLGKAPSADMQAELGQRVTWLGGVARPARDPAARPSGGAPGLDRADRASRPRDAPPGVPVLLETLADRPPARRATCACSPGMPCTTTASPRGSSR